jgi:phage shock protein B
VHEIVALVAEVIPFVFVISIVWLVMHYRHIRRAAKEIPAAVNASNAQLMSVAERMEHRIDALEEILDAEAPGWREKYREHS